MSQNPSSNQETSFNDRFENCIKRFNKEQKFKFFIIVLFCISLPALFFSLTDIDCKFLQYSPDHFAQILGFLVSSVAIVVTAYLVIIDLNASNRQRYYEKHARRIKAEYEAINKTYVETKKINDEIINSQKSLGDFLIATFDDAIAKADLDKKKDLRQALKAIRVRTLFSSPLIDVETRKSLIKELTIYGKKSDLVLLDKIVNNPMELKEIIDVAKRVADSLKKKFRI